MSSVDLLGPSRARFARRDSEVNDIEIEDDEDELLEDDHGTVEIPSSRQSVHLPSPLISQLAPLSGADVEANSFMRNNPYVAGDKPLQYERRVTKVVEDVQRVAIEWKDVSYSVPGSCFGRRKTLLDNVSGYALPGEVLAIMGPSGLTSSRSPHVFHLPSCFS